MSNFEIKILENYDDDIVKKFMEWRNKKRDCFTHKDKVTLESTKKWLDTFDENRKLFTVIQDETIIGHFFLSNDNEIGSVLKNPNHRNSIMGPAIKQVMKKGENYWLNVLADNTKAIKFYKKNGFKIKRLKIIKKLPHYHMVYET